MNLIEKIRETLIGKNRLEKLKENPDSSRLTFIFDNEAILRAKVNEYKTWYIGESAELLNFYRNTEIWQNACDPFYFENRKNYFWGLSSLEGDIKRVHSGIPNAIVTTLVNAIGNPKVTSNDEMENITLEHIMDVNDMTTKLNQLQIPLTLAEGWGAFKINYNKSLCQYPLIQYYDADRVRFLYEDGILTGITFIDYYKYNSKNYVFLETRKLENNSSIIENKLFLLKDNDNIDEVPLNSVPQLANVEDIIIPNYNKILSVPSKFFFDPLNQDYGKSIFAGKIDLFDMLDEDLSQNSQTVRVSTPVEYFPVDTMEHGANGSEQAPKIYNRQYIKINSIPNGDGNTDSEITTTQPVLNFQQYSDNAKHILDTILTGILSPATMGIDIAKKDNADAQREKEKVTIMTRNNVIAGETKILKNLYSMCLDVYEFMTTGHITLQEHEINIKFDEFANPSFENELQVLAPAYTSGGISAEQYVELLWGDKLSDEEKAEEVARIKERMQQDNLQWGDISDADTSKFDRY